MSSWTWVAVIVVGGALVVVGNIQYARSKSTEDKAKLAAVVREIVKPELVKNRRTMVIWETTAERREIAFQTFDTGAWEAVSKGAMLSALKPMEVSSLTLAYERMLQANATHTRLFDLGVGTASALVDAVAHKEYLLSNLRVQLKELRAALDSLPDDLKGNDGP